MECAECEHEISKSGAAKFWFGLIGVMPAGCAQYLYWPVSRLLDSALGVALHLILWGVSAFLIMWGSIRLGRYVDRVAFAQPTMLRRVAVGIGAHAAFFAVAWITSMTMYAVASARF